MYGLAFLAGAKYPDLVLRESPEGWAIAIFLKLFGDAVPLINELLSKNRTPRITIDGLWDDDHIFGRSDFPEAMRLAREAEKVALRFPSVDVRYAPMVEHHLDASLFLELARAIRKECPHITVVNIPDKKGPIIKGCLNELHAFRAPPPQAPRIDFNFDGHAAVDSDVEAAKRRYSAAETFYFWEPNFNLRWETNDTTPRPDRKCRPTSELIDSVIYLHRDIGGKVRLESRCLYKSHSERKEKPDPRADKPVFIIPPKVARVELHASNGQIVSVANRYRDPYKDGRWRYYFQEMGYLIAEKARRIQDGSPLVSVVAGGKKLGTINPAFRAGDFRD